MTNVNDPFDVFNSPESSSGSSIVLQGIRTKTSELSPYTLQMQSLQTRIPVVSDKALIDLVNGIQVSGEVVRYRKSRNFFGRLMDTLTGGERERELLVQGNLIGGQATLHQQFRIDYLQIRNSLNEDAATLKKRTEKIRELRDFYTITDEFPVWPFDIKTFRRYLLTIPTPLLAPLFGLLQKLYEVLLK